MSPGDEHDYGEPAGTRMRLPEADPYGGARRPARSSSRSMVMAAGVVVLLIAAIAFANRGGDDSPSTAATGGTNADQPKTSSTAASGTKPVDGKSAGIPSGYARDGQGAQSAAANYTVVLGSAEMFNTARRHQIVDTVYTPDVAAVRQSSLDAVYSNETFLNNIGLDKDGTAPNGQVFVSRIAPVGTKITAYSVNAATVEVWYTSLFGLSGEASTNPVSESWYTNIFQLKWIGNDWKVADFQQKDGPVPVGRDQKASTADDMTKAVEEYGGFTYAR
ncbi:hypothetical protein BM536_016410 [Streptomyces phaeoluteigriseus]|uniref:Uncharacterized protein n=1 Tax=Streptomyces phaeoluteigriseus TaxID=114686 RepID=A0A1V6MU30_9ACTN|nr:hypothetical protein [Streptomyces phaeoluteigriseus]OQD55984.1 hypothetical protein BM536_016410 [Streptomyces phaeoluteigriseus]